METWTGLTQAIKTNDGKKVDVHFPTTPNRTIKFDWDNTIKPKQEEAGYDTPIKISRGCKPNSFYLNPQLEETHLSPERPPKKRVLNQLSSLTKTPIISKENPNEPNDNYEDVKPFKLKREL